MEWAVIIVFVVDNPEGGFGQVSVFTHCDSLNYSSRVPIRIITLDSLGQKSSFKQIGRQFRVIFNALIP